MNRLAISNGTTIIEFLSLAEDGARLVSWRPKIQQPKQGGVFQDSPMAPGRRRVYSQLGNAVEIFTFSVEESCLNDIFGTTSDLVSLLDQGVEYWETNHQNTPTYIQVTTKNGNTQYAVIKSYTIPELDNPFAQPLYGQYNALLDSVTLEVERGDWLSLPPGQSELVTTNVVSTAASEVYIASKFSTTQMTHIYVDDGGVFGANQVAAASFDLLPASPAVNDAVYFGNDTPYSFGNLIFDLSSGFAGSTATGVWQAWSGSTWASLLDEVDETSSLSETGINALTWRNLNGSTIPATSVNGVNAFWVRFLVTGASGITSIPTQQNRIVYHATSPYLDITGSDIAGTIPALARVALRKAAQTSVTTTESYLLGTRSKSRGEDFNAYLNLSDAQAQTGVTITLVAGTGVAYQTNNRAPTTREIFYDASTDTNGNGSSFRKFYIDLSTTLSQQYIGRFKAMIGVYPSSSFTASYLIRLVAGNSDDTLTFFDSGELDLNVTGISTFGGNVGMQDMGVVAIPDTIGVTTGLRFGVYLNTDAKTEDISFCWLLLMPVDETSVLVTGTPAVDNTRYADIDSLDPKKPILGTIKNKADNSLYYIMTNSANNPLQLSPGRNQRLWLHTITDVSDAGGGGQNTFSDLHKALLYKNERFKTFRGSS